MYSKKLHFGVVFLAIESWLHVNTQSILFIACAEWVENTPRFIRMLYFFFATQNICWRILRKNARVKTHLYINFRQQIEENENICWMSDTFRRMLTFHLFQTDFASFDGKGKRSYYIRRKSCCNLWLKSFNYNFLFTISTWNREKTHTVSETKERRNPHTHTHTLTLSICQKSRSYHQEW